MRIRTLFVTLGLAALAAGCQKGSSNYAGGSSAAASKTSASTGAQRSMPANAEPLKEAIATYLARPENRISEPEFLAISEPIPIKQNEGAAQAYWVQYTATNSYGLPQISQHDLFLLKGGQVVAHYRTADEIQTNLGIRWAKEHRPPSWPEVKPAKVKKPEE